MVLDLDHLRAEVGEDAPGHRSRKPKRTARRAADGLDDRQPFIGTCRLHFSVRSHSLNIFAQVASAA